MSSRSAPVVAIHLILMALLLTPPAPAEAAAPAAMQPVVDLIEAGDFSAARGQLASLSAADSEGWFEYLQGRLLLAEGEVETSIEQLELATAASPETAPFRRWLGEAYIAQIDTVNMFKKRGIAMKALAELKEAARLDPHDLATRETLVGYYLEAPAIVGGGDDKALAEAKDLAGIDPTGGHLLMAQIKSQHDDHEGAIEHYEAAAVSRPDDPQLRYGLGMAQQGLERYPEAFSAFERAIEVDPAYMNPYYQLARTAVLAETNLERGVESMLVYLNHDVQPNSAGHEHAHWRLGMLYGLMNDSAAAGREFEKALELDPDHEEAKKALKALGR